MNCISDLMMETSVNGVVGALQGIRDRPDSSPFLPQIKCPALIIHGADDQLISYHKAVLMKKQLPDSRLVILPEAGHLPNLEQPERFNQAVRDYILSLAQD